MYSFFSNRLKMKAFKTALKQVEAEGFFVDLTVDEDPVAILPDLSRAIAGLSKKTPKNLEKDNNISETVNVAELGAEMDTYIPSAKPSQSARQSRTSKQTSAGLYDGMFKSSSSLLTDEDIDEPEFLDGKRKGSFKGFDFGAFAKNREKTARNLDDNSDEDQLSAETTETSSKISSLLEQLRNKAEEPDDYEEFDESDIPEIEADIEMPIMQQESEELPEPAKVTVEVVADIPEPETITKTVYVTKEVPVPVEVKPAPRPKAKKSTTPRKKKRKYDADISGGFDY